MHEIKKEIFSRLILFYNVINGDRYLDLKCIYFKMMPLFFKRKNYLNVVFHKHGQEEIGQSSGHSSLQTCTQ